MLYIFFKYFFSFSH